MKGDVWQLLLLSVPFLKNSSHLRPPALRLGLPPEMCPRHSTPFWTRQDDAQTTCIASNSDHAIMCGIVTATLREDRVPFLDQFHDDLGFKAMRHELQLVGDLNVTMPQPGCQDAPININCYSDGGLTHPECPNFGLGTAGLHWPGRAGQTSLWSISYLSRN